MDRFQMEGEPMVKGKSLYKRTCQCRCLPVVLVILTSLSLATSVVTAIVYYRAKDTKPDEPILTSPARPQVGNHLSIPPHCPAYAHKILFLDFTNVPNADSGENVRLKINEDRDDVRFEVSHGVSLLPDGIQIKQSGNYFVYKNIFFAPYSRGSCDEMEDQTFTSMLIRNTSKTHGGSRSCLLKSIHTCCPSCRDNSETAFTGGTFYLDQGDIIQVEVTEHESIDVEKDVTFMGLMML